MQETTIENLPDEVLNLIFSRVNFHGHLRLSSVCRRFLQLIAKDVTFMRTVDFRAEQTDLQKILSLNPQATLMRAYRNVVLSGLDNFENWSAMELQLLESVENLELRNCKFRDASEFVSFLKHCKHLKSVHLGIMYCMFEDHGASEPTEKYQNPVSLNIISLDCDFLWVCFANIVDICVRDWGQEHKIRLLNMLKNHGSVVTSMKISKEDTDMYLKVLTFLFKKPELKKLKNLNLTFDNNRHVEQLVQLFAHIKSSLTKLSTGAEPMGQSLFDAIRLNLVNLEILDLWVTQEHNIRPNDLKVLTKLKSLSLGFECFEDDYVYELDLDELLSLEYLVLLKLDDNFKLVLKRPVVTLKKLELAFEVDAQFLRQVGQMFPNLQSLELESYFQSKKNNSVLINPVDEINKLAELRSFACSCDLYESHSDLINDEFLSNLRLPNLSKLNFYRPLGESLKISRSALNALARNCPSLLRITKTDEVFNLRHEIKKNMISILFKRMNSNQEFRRVRRPAAMENFKKMDVDSMESCSDEDDIVPNPSMPDSDLFGLLEKVQSFFDEMNLE